MIGDRHIHTCFSLDSDSSVEKVAETAIRLGMKEICITDHCDFDLGEGWVLPVKEYGEAMLEYKKRYEDRIALHIGIEMGLNPEFDDQIEGILSAFPFEYVIGSIHSMLGEDPYFRDRYDMEDPEFFRVYYETMLERIRRAKNIDVCGHFDYVIRYGIHGAGQYDPEKYADLIDEILKEIIRRDIAMELNTAGLRKRAGFIHPHAFILQRYRDLGGHWISVGSDAHAFEHVGSDFNAVEELMREYGLTEQDLKPYRSI